MCEASAYVVRNMKEELLMEGVDLLEDRDGQIHMTNLFGEQKTIRARIKALALVDHKIILEPLP